MYKEGSKKTSCEWLCRCDCGNEKIVSRSSLLNGTSSCGCLRTQNLIGEVFGNLLVIDRDSKKYKHRGSHWVCRCICGKTTSVRADSLKNGSTQSCGCILINSAREKSKTFSRLPKKTKKEVSFNRILDSYKRSAKKRGLCFDLEKDDFFTLLSSPCFYCGYKEKVGIDRINNLSGYTTNNCVSCCYQCNRAKSAMSQQEFYAWIERVYNHSILKGRE